MSLTVQEIMTRNPVSVSPSDAILSVMDLMRSHKIDHVTVVEDEVLKGIISKTDLYKQLLKLSMTSSGKTYAEKELMATLVGSVMTSDPVNIAPEQSVSLASEIILQGVFHAIPVVDHGRLVGIVTARDVVKQMIDG